ncbi:MAG: tetratricopeptide repeat protein, partial [Lysobacterales bacterium]
MLDEARQYINDKDYAEGARLIGKHLDANFDDAHALFLLGFCFMQTDAVGLAYQAFKASGDIFPGEPATWHNIGKLYHEVQKDETAAEFFKKALKVKPNFAHALAGLAMTNLNAGDYQAAIMYANRAVAEDPTDVEAKTNRGMSYLALRRWREGWIDYQGNCGVDKNRRIFTYGKSVMWDGEKGK